MSSSDDDEKRRRQIAENIARALGKAGATVKIEDGKILAFKRPVPKPKGNQDE